ncbi:PREDICTED: LIM/homeobox protein Awh [Rhagoletis zephyria]|uniref:LIM/homeobox protein Awh n=1 Tax=Rhagoletis zephyria TaxID=28612 RepID=UPI000811669C|nr:PREDICTED: LIM/homeobox protein Awh [Rhagoletis zephyria]
MASGKDQKCVAFKNTNDDATELRSCAACGEPISDRFFLEVGGCSWHATCLRCCICQCPLDRQQSCFIRERQVYCKADYGKHFGAKCSKCCRGISASDWVRRARDLVFHLACFACDQCGRQLSTGEQFALIDDRVLCKAHYLETVEGGTTSSDVREPEGSSFARHINLQLTYSFQNNAQNPMHMNGNSKGLYPSHESSMDELSQDSSVHCMQSEV